MKNKAIIAVDFDGTCVTHEFPKIGKEVPSAVRVLKRLVDSNCKIILYTMRADRHKENPTKTEGIFDVTGNFLSDAVKWFIDRKIPLYGINENPTQKEWTTSPKVFANYYIDDMALGVPLIYPNGERPFVDWDKIEILLEKDG